MYTSKCFAKSCLTHGNSSDFPFFFPTESSVMCIKCFDKLSLASRSNSSSVYDVKYDSFVCLYLRLMRLYFSYLYLCLIRFYFSCLYLCLMRFYFSCLYLCLFIQLFSRFDVKYEVHLFSFSRFYFVYPRTS